MTATRQRWRRRLLLLGLLPLIGALALTLKVAVMLSLNEVGRAQLDDGAYGAAARSFATAGLLNLLEPWVAPYDQGTAAYLEDDYVRARDLLESALADVPDAEECRVRVNLALTHEALGDATRADGDVAAARAEWATARAVLAEGECTGAAEPTPTHRSAAAVDHRVAEKIAETAAPPPARRTPHRSEEDAASLRERNERGAERRSERLQRLEEKDDVPPPPDGAAPPVYHW